MKLVSFLPQIHSFPEYSFRREGDFSVTFLPWVKTHGYKHFTPKELFLGRVNGLFMV
jgi:hypothetical protein